jgi:hypothetical protein
MRILETGPLKLEDIRHVREFRRVSHNGTVTGFSWGRACLYRVDSVKQAWAPLRKFQQVSLTISTP